MSTGGKRAGARRGTRRRPALQPRLLGLALAVTVSVVAWGYLVYAAIDFGAAARGGDRDAWWFLALASLGAVACLFVGLMLVARLLRELGITRPPEPETGRVTPTDRPPRSAPTAGGHRATR
ncbi:hypothetical protein [Nocardioides ferulae]|uniref:hypothetical protein n=1 Tax=Nocardioides ferulae TaxID=2340821 RepID=UPI000EAE7A1F|nr:hypothetical protein [Nocardioides ferulae]